MQPGDEAPAGSARTTGDPRERLAASARGWHRIQLAVLGFIGFCGVLWGSGTEPAGPAWLQWLAGALVLLALVLAGLATYLVGRVAHPLDRPATEPAAGPGAGEPPPVARGARRLRAGIAITYASVAVLAVATLSAWWPAPAGDPAPVVEVRDAAGGAWCGELVAAPAGIVRLDTAEGPVSLPLNGIASLDPVNRC